MKEKNKKLKILNDSLFIKIHHYEKFLFKTKPINNNFMKNQKEIYHKKKKSQKIFRLKNVKKNLIKKKKIHLLILKLQI